LHFHHHHFNQSLFHGMLSVAASDARPDPGPEPPPSPQTHTLHDADANAVVVQINLGFLHALESMLQGDGPLSGAAILLAFQDFLLEARKLERGEERGIPPTIVGLDFSVRDLLAHTPLQSWPFPHVYSSA
jgi:hypothetical protein